MIIIEFLKFIIQSGEKLYFYNKNLIFFNILTKWFSDESKNHCRTISIIFLIKWDTTLDARREVFQPPESSGRKQFLRYLKYARARSAYFSGIPRGIKSEGGGGTPLGKSRRDKLIPAVFTGASYVIRAPLPLLVYYAKVRRSLRGKEKKKVRTAFFSIYRLK